MISEDEFMAIVKVQKLEIGTGVPKICVPIIEKTESTILEAAEEIVKTSADLVEWRVDWFEEIFDFDKVKSILGKLRDILGDRPILFTCRTETEGGEISLSSMQYKKISQIAIESGCADMIDIELLHYLEAGKELIMAAHASGIKVVGSNHDFYSTPEKEEMIRRLVSMQEEGADIVKIAVMPKDEQDVETLLSATDEMRREYNSTPVVMISMGVKGMISRIAGERYGSSITFGVVGKASAPGQIEVEELRKMMKEFK